MQIGRPQSKIHFGPTGKNITSTKKVTRDEQGELQLTVSLAKDGDTRIHFGKPVTYISLTPDKAYDFAHLILENVKDKQGGEPVNITEEKILDALAFALAKHGVGVKMEQNARDLAVILAQDFMTAMASGEAQP